MKKVSDLHVLVGRLIKFPLFVFTCKSRIVHTGWFRGRLKNKEGVFPSNFVEVTQGNTDDLPVMPTSDNNHHNDADTHDSSKSSANSQKRQRVWNAAKHAVNDLDVDSEQPNSLPGKTSPRGIGGPPGAVRAGFGNIFKGGPVQLRSVAKRGEQKVSASFMYGGLGCFGSRYFHEYRK